MACKSCEERRKMLAEARKQGAKGIVKVLPIIAVHSIRNPPKIRK